MCMNAARLITEKALKAAEAEWELVATIKAEAKVHSGVVIEARHLLKDRRDDLALSIFDQVMGWEPAMDRARELVESTGAAREERGR